MGVLGVRVYEGQHLVAEARLLCVSWLVSLEERARDLQVWRGAGVYLSVCASAGGHDAAQGCLKSLR